LGGSVHTIKKNREALLVGSKEASLEVNAEKPQRKKPLGRPRHRWEEIIKMDLQEVGYWDMDWIYLVEYSDRWRALVSAVMNHRFP
jgi:hypothetical protein